MPRITINSLVAPNGVLQGLGQAANTALQVPGQLEQLRQQGEQRRHDRGRSAIQDLLAGGPLFNQGGGRGGSSSGSGGGSGKGAHELGLVEALKTARTSMAEGPLGAKLAQIFEGDSEATAQFVDQFTDQLTDAFSLNFQGARFRDQTGMDPNDPANKKAFEMFLTQNTVQAQKGLMQSGADPEFKQAYIDLMQRVHGVNLSQVRGTNRQADKAAERLLAPGGSAEKAGLTGQGLNAPTDPNAVRSTAQAAKDKLSGATQGILDDLKNEIPTEIDFIEAGNRVATVAAGQLADGVKELDQANADLAEFETALKDLPFTSQDRSKRTKELGDQAIAAQARVKSSLSSVFQQVLASQGVPAKQAAQTAKDMADSPQFLTLARQFSHVANLSEEEKRNFGQNLGLDLKFPRKDRIGADDRTELQFLITRRDQLDGDTAAAEQELMQMKNARHDEDMAKLMFALVKQHMSPVNLPGGGLVANDPQQLEQQLPPLQAIGQNPNLLVPPPIP